MKKKKTEIQKKVMNDLRVVVGFVKGKALIQALPISDCRGPNCPIHERCSHKKSGKCKYEELYVNSFYQPLVDPLNGIGDRLSQRRLDEIGRKLLPLMQRLVKINIDLMAIDMVNKKPFGMAYEDSKGRIHMYPQYKAHDDTLKSIALIEGGLKLTEIWEKKFGGAKEMPSAEDAEGIFKTGRRGAYEELLEETIQAETDQEEEEDEDEPECPADREVEETREEISEYEALYNGMDESAIYSEDGEE
ncbi:MAG: hypothetical protein C4576_11415 [Desulfobacteraceae bacterium]|nr:MAG: hypothetical protein C4576_11415 [Desulfobacteraceae bacterium]